MKQLTFICTLSLAVFLVSVPGGECSPIPIHREQVASNKDTNSWFLVRWFGSKTTTDVEIGTQFESKEEMVRFKRHTENSRRAEATDTEEDENAIIELHEIFKSPGNKNFTEASNLVLANITIASVNATALERRSVNNTTLEKRLINATSIEIRNINDILGTKKNSTLFEKRYVNTTNMAVNFTIRDIRSKFNNSSFFEKRFANVTHLDIRDLEGESTVFFQKRFSNATTLESRAINATHLEARKHNATTLESVNLNSLEERKLNGTKFDSRSINATSLFARSYNATITPTKIVRITSPALLP